MIVLIRHELDMRTVRPEPFDFAQESPVEACPEPADWELCFDRSTGSRSGRTVLMFKPGRINGRDSGCRFDETENSAPDKQETAMNRLAALRDPGSWRLLGGIIHAGRLAGIVDHLVDAFDALTPWYAEG